MAAKRKDNKGRVLHQGESQRKDGTYMYRYTNIFKKRITVYATTLQELREKEKEVLTSDPHMQSKESNITVIQLAERYCALKTGLKKSTKGHYNCLLSLIRRYPIANMQAKKVSVSTAKLWLIELRNEGRAVSSIYTLGRFLNSVYKMGIEGDLFIKNPFSFRMDLFSEGRNKRDALTPQEQDAFLNFLKSTPSYSIYYDYTVILLNTGMRAGEFIGLTLDDVNLEEGYVSVNKQLRKWSNGAPYVDTPKSKAGVRKIPLTREAHKAFERVLERWKDHKDIPIIDGVSNFIIIGKYGDLYGATSLAATYARLNKNFNESHEKQVHITPHILRHTFCTNMARAGVSSHYLQYVMGHSSAAITAEVYTHRTYEDARLDMSKVLELA